MSSNFELLRSIQKQTDKNTKALDQMKLDIENINKIGGKQKQKLMTIFSDGSSNFHQDFTGINNDFGVVENTIQTNIYVTLFRIYFETVDSPAINSIYNIIPVFVNRLVILNDAGNVVEVIFDNLKTLEDVVASGFHYDLQYTDGNNRFPILDAVFKTPVKILPDYYLAYELKENFSNSVITPPCVQYFYYDSE